MAITRTDAYQYPLTLFKRFTYDQVTNAEGALAAGLIPPGAVLIGGGVVVATAWDDTADATLDVGDSDNPDRYSDTPIDLKSTGHTALDVTGHKYTAPTDLDIQMLVGNDDGTAGEAFIYATVIIEDRQQENAS